MYSITFGSVFKDIVKLVFVVFTFTLCVFIFMLNTNVHWLYNNCGISSSDKEKHKPSPTPVLFASIFIALIGLVMIYGIYEFYTKRRIIGFN